MTDPVAADVDSAVQDSADRAASIRSAIATVDAGLAKAFDADPDADIDAEIADMQVNVSDSGS